MNEKINTGYSRRQFLNRGTNLTLAMMLVSPSFSRAQRDLGSKKGMRICLTPGSIGVSAGQLETIDLAVKHGYEAVEPFGGYLASLSDEQNQDLLESLRENGLVWGAAGLPVNFRRDEETFQNGLGKLPAIAAALKRAGTDRVGTWLTPAHSSLSYIRNFKLHARRLKAVARILADHRLRFGLEYVGTKTSLNRRKYPFIHTMAETHDLIAEIDEPNMGLVLDSWHWWQADDTVEDILGLKPEQVVSVDLNDAPLNVPKEQQIDNQRELPAVTGVIDLPGFMKALQKIGYDGPVRPEPFNKELNGMDNDQACSATVLAMRNAFDSIR